MAKCKPETLFGGKFLDQMAESIEVLAKEALANNLPKLVDFTVKSDDGQILAQTSKDQHRYFELAMRCLLAGVPLALTGPKGSGKTTIALEAAKLLGREATLVQCHRHLTKTEVFGYIQPGTDDRCAETPVTKAMARGDVLILDEFDACSAESSILFNAIVANRTMTRPNGETIKAHNDFKIVFCMNTIGVGASQEYLGRSALDSAARDRLVFLEVPYDTNLERRAIGLAPEPLADLDIAEGGLVDAGLIHRLTVQARNQWPKNQVSPRASINASKLAAAGIGRRWIEEIVYKPQIPATAWGSGLACVS